MRTTRADREGQGFPIVRTLHAIIPCFNEGNTLGRCVRRLFEIEWPAGWAAEVIIIDDHSTDDSIEVARKLAHEYESIELITQPRNSGKGAAVRRGMESAISRGQPMDLVVIQDADLEYDPADLPGMIHRFETEPETIAVFGDRFDSGRRSSAMGRLHKLVNRSLTWMSNRFTRLDLQDMECCYKMIRLDLVEQILAELTENRFGIEPQITAAVSRHGVDPTNHVVNYTPRGFQDGKKIRIKDGFRALYVIIKEACRRNRR